jgi:hypothetical protein
MYRLSYGRNIKNDRPTLNELTQLAADGLTKKEIAAALDMKADRLYYLLNKYDSLNQAYLQGVGLHQRKYGIEKEAA